MGTRHHALKIRQRQERDAYPEGLSLRVLRALSWLDRAEQEFDPDSRFIFLWIAFNAAYTSEIDDRQGLSDQATFRAFLKQLHDLGHGKGLAEIVWNALSGAIRVLLDKSYVVAGVWDYKKGNQTEAQWQQSFRAASQSLAAQDTPKLLTIVLARICPLRNQLIHGGVIWVSSVNRDPIRDCMSIMGELVPIGSGILMDSAATLWGDAGYPVIVAAE